MTEVFFSRWIFSKTNSV